MKRKYIICVLMLLLSFIFIDSSIVPTYADTSFSTTTYNPTLDENNVVSDYLNLENITYFSVLNNSIYYTTDSTSLNCYSLDTKSVTTIDYEFTNIDYITSALGYLFVSDNHSLLAFKNNMCLLSAFPYTAPSNYDCISFYEDGEDLYIAFIKDDNL
ncbi:MAG: hypothetical protein IJW28_03385 [Clostridia bacterium]|nr:hypothetical protein [Clostridia bacterium]